MKKLTMLLLLISMSNILYAQNPNIGVKIKKEEQKLPAYSSAEEAINKTRDSLENPTNNPDMLVSRYTFKNIIKNDFSTLIGSDNTASVGKFAALTVNQSTSAFTFTPYTYSRTNLVERNFKHVYSIDFAGTVDKSNLLDLKNWRTVNLSFSYTTIGKTVYKFNSSAKKTAKNTERHLAQISGSDYETLYNDLRTRILSTYQATLKSKVSNLQHPEFAPDDEGNYSGAVKAYLDSISKYEQIMTKKGWTTKSFSWFKLTASPLAFDNTNLIDSTNITTFNKPTEKVFWTPSISGSINGYWASNKGFNFYLSFLLQGVWKDQFTDVATATEWDKISRLTDSAFTKTSTKNIFTVGSTDIKRRLLPNASAEAIILFPAPGMFGLGIDASYGFNGIISNKAGHDTGWLSNTQLGLIFSFKDKNGTSNINIEPYYQSKRYIEYVLASSHLWGVKFSIPIGRLY